MTDAYKGAVFALSGTFYSSDGPTLFFPEFDSPATNYGVTSNTNYESYQRVLATVTYHGFTLQGLYNAQNKGVPTAYFGALFNDPRTRNLQGIDYLDLSYDHTLGHSGNSMRGLPLTRTRSTDRWPTSQPSLPPDIYSYDGQWWDSEIKLSRPLPTKQHTYFRDGDYRQLSAGSVQFRSRRQPANHKGFHENNHMGGIRPDRVSDHGESFP